MPQEEQPKEEKPENQPAPPESNGAATPPELEAIKAELEQERQAKAAVEKALAEKDALITTLQTQLSEAKQASEAATNQLAQLQEAHTKAVSKYLDAVKASHPTIPGDVIGGQTIDDIDASLKKALTIAAAVQASLEAQAKQAKVPAGAPARGEISTEGLSPRELIALGIQQTKGGT